MGMPMRSIASVMKILFFTILTILFVRTRSMLLFCGFIAFVFIFLSVLS